TRTSRRPEEMACDGGASMIALTMVGDASTSPIPTIPWSVWTRTMRASWVLSAAPTSMVGMRRTRASTSVMRMAPPSPLPGVERVAKAVAQEVHSEDGQQDEQGGEDRDPRREPHVVATCAEDVAPRRGGRRGAEPEETERGLGQDHLRELDAGLDHQRRDDAGADVAPGDAEALGDQ